MSSTDTGATRAPRRGEKVSFSAAVNVVPSAAAAAAAAPHTDLLGAFLQSNQQTDTVKSPVGVVIRGRGGPREAQSPVTDSVTGPARDSVIAKLAAAVAAVQADTATEPSIDLEALSRQDISLVSEGMLTVLPARVVVADADARVLVTVPSDRVADVTASIGASSRVTVVPYSVLCTLTEEWSNAAPNGAFPFSHVCVAASQDRSAAMFDIALASVCRAASRAPKGTWKSRIVVFGVGEVSEIANQAGKLTAGVIEVDASVEPVVFGEDDCAAVAGAAVRTRGPAFVTVSRRAVQQESGDITRRQLQQADAAAAACVYEVLATSQGQKVNVAVVCSNAHSMMTSIQQVMKEKGVEAVSIIKSPKKFKEARAKGVRAVLLLTSSLGEEARTLPLHVVIDQGTQRCIQLAGNEDHGVAVKRRCVASKRESESRVAMARWAGSTKPGVVMRILDATAEYDAEESIGDAAEAVLVAARAGLSLGVFSSGSRAQRVQNAMTTLRELAWANPPSRPNDSPKLTFFGDLVARLGLPMDVSMIVVNGVVFGVPDAALMVAVAAMAPISKSNKDVPATADGNGALVRDASLLAEAAAENPSEIFAFCEKNELDHDVVVSALAHFHAARQHVADYAVPDLSPFSATSLLRDLSEHATSLVAFIAAALPRRAVVVRSEADARRNETARGNLLFAKTSKAVEPNAYYPSAKWTKGSVIIASDIQNNESKFLVSGSTVVSDDFLLGSLFALWPVVASFRPSSGNESDDEDVETRLLIQVNGIEKASLATSELAGRLMALRAQWCQLATCIQLRRALMPSGHSAVREAIQTHIDRRMNVERLQSELLAEVAQFALDFRAAVPTSDLTERERDEIKVSLLTPGPLPAGVKALPGSQSVAAARLLQAAATKEETPLTSDALLTVAAKPVEEAPSARAQMWSDTESEEGEAPIVDDD
jgi:predicted component of type VI protein secretion system